MKKIIGILGVAVFAAAMFLNTNTVNGSSSDTSLANLLTLNSANAECIVSPIQELNSGGCSPLTGNCYAGDTFRPDRCDPWAPNQG